MHIVSGGRDGTVSVWESRTGARLIHERAHAAAVTEITGLGGNNIFSTSLDATVKVRARKWGHTGLDALIRSLLSLCADMGLQRPFSAQSQPDTPAKCNFFSASISASSLV